MPQESPLTDLKNSSVLVTLPSTIQQVDGRYTDAGVEEQYLIRSYLQRAEGKGTEDGRQNTFGSKATTGGGATSSWVLRGYAIEYVEILPEYGFIHGTTDESQYAYLSLVSGGPTDTVLDLPLRNNYRVSVRHGNYPDIFEGIITNIGGKYQGLGPDQTIYYELQAVPITLSSAAIVS